MSPGPVRPGDVWSGRASPGRTLAFGVLERDALGSALLAHERSGPAAMPDLGPREVELAGRMAWPARRHEWVAGRAVAKAALLEAFALASWRVEILPAASGAPEVHVDGARRADLHVSISHTRHCAVAAVSLAPVGVDACDDDDGPRLPRIARRVFDDGEAEACGAHVSPETQAAVWALKEAGLKLHGGGILMPGLRSVRVESLEPARVADPSMRVALFRLPHAAVAVAQTHGGPI